MRVNWPIFLIEISLRYNIQPVDGALRQQIGAPPLVWLLFQLPFLSYVVTAGCLNTQQQKPPPQFHLYPRLQQFIQLYWNLYITVTLYSGEIVGRIIHVTLCDAAQGHKYWCERTEGDGGWGRGHTQTHTLSSACHHLPVSIPTCTAWNSPDGHVRRDGALLRCLCPPAPSRFTENLPFR